MPTEITGPSFPAPQQLVQEALLVCTQTMEQAVLLTEREWEQRAVRSRRTGTYLRSITHRVVRHGLQVVGQVGSNVPQARYLEEGTGLYGPRNQRIVPRHARALRFPRGGGQTFSPGTGAYTGFANAPGFRQTGQQRQGAAGRAASWVFVRSVRGIRPRRYAHDAALVVHPQVVRLFADAGRRIARLGLGRA